MSAAAAVVPNIEPSSWFCPSASAAEATLDHLFGTCPGLQPARTRHMVAIGHRPGRLPVDIHRWSHDPLYKHLLHFLAETGLYNILSCMKPSSSHHFLYPYSVYLSLHIPYLHYYNAQLCSLNVVIYVRVKIAPKTEIGFQCFPFYFLQEELGMNFMNKKKFLSPQLQPSNKRLLPGTFLDLRGRIGVKLFFLAFITTPTCTLQSRAR